MTLKITEVDSGDLIKTINTDTILTTLIPDNDNSRTFIVAHNEKAECRVYDYANGVEKHSLNFGADGAPVAAQLCVLGEFKFKSKIGNSGQTKKEGILDTASEEGKTREKEVLEKVSQVRAMKKRVDRVIDDVAGINADGVYIVATIDHELLELWDVNTERKIATMSSMHEDTITTFKSTASGHLMSGSKDGQVNYFA